MNVLSGWLHHSLDTVIHNRLSRQAVRVPNSTLASSRNSSCLLVVYLSYELVTNCLK